MSTSTAVFLMLIAIAVLEIRTVIVFTMLKKEIGEMRSWYSMIFGKLTDAYEAMASLDKSRQDLYEKIVECDGKMNEALTASIETDHKIIDAWKQIANGLKESTKVNNDIMNAWHDVEENYSMAYEEYRLCLEKLEALDTKITEIDEHTKPIDISVMPTFGDMYEEKEDDE